MEAQALKMIQDTALTAAAKPIDGTLMPLVAMPKDVMLANLEQYLPNRLRFRGSFATSSIKDFCRYCTSRTTETGFSSKGFISIGKSLSCEMIFNIGNAVTAGHCDDTAAMTLQPTALFNAVTRLMTARDITQRELAEWIEEWSEYVTAHDSILDSGKKLSLAASVTAIRKLTIKSASEKTSEVGDFTAARSALESIAATSVEVLPASLAVKVTPYEGVNEIAIKIRLSVITSGESPKFRVHWIREEAQREEIAQDFCNKLTGELGGLADIYIGGFSA